MKEKLFNKLSVARKAGKITYGFESVKEEVLKGKASLVLLANDLSSKSAKETEFFCKDKATVVKTDISMSEYANHIGVLTGIITLTDDGFTKAVKSVLEVE